MLLLPPLDSLRFLEAAARHRSFARAATELDVTPAAVAHRVRMLEKYLDIPLFDRRRRGVDLNRSGQTYLKEVQRILAEVHGVSERQRRSPRRVRIVSVEAVAEVVSVHRGVHHPSSPGLAWRNTTLDNSSRELSTEVCCSSDAPPVIRSPLRSQEDTAMKTIAGSTLCAVVCLSATAAAQTLVGALAVDEGQGDQYGWAVDYETAGTAGQRALSECGPGCSVVLTFERCAAYAADQDAGSTVDGWAESYDSAAGARHRALAECSTRGSGCTVRVWGCNGQVVEESLGLDRAARCQVQEGLEAAGFDPGGADGMFGPRTRAAIQSWQTSRGARATGYLDGASVSALRPSLAGQPTFREREPAGTAATSAAAPAVPAAVSAAQQQRPRASAELEGLFWQSIMNSTNPAEFEAYLTQFPNGVFRALAEARLAALRAPAPATPAATGRPTGVGSPVSGSGGASFGVAADADARRGSDDVFRDCAECPEMVVLAGGGLALGRYEVTVGEYRAFVSATGGTSDDRWRDHGGFPQTDRHPVTWVSWDDAQEYVSWLSRRTGAAYRLPTEAEWERAASGSQPGCDRLGRGARPVATCPVGSHGSNAAGLSDMVGNLWEWTSDCWEGNCGRRVVRGGSWRSLAGLLRPSARDGISSAGRGASGGFRVSRTLD